MVWPGAGRALLPLSFVLLAAAAAFVLDEPASPVVDVVPTGPGRRTAVRALALLVPLGVGGALVLAVALRLLTLPDQIVEAAQQSNPSVLVRHMLDIANIYNSYYSRAAVIADDSVNPVRYQLTQATANALTSALEICHIEVPAAI